MTRPIPRHDHSTDDEDETNLVERSVGSSFNNWTKESLVEKAAENPEIDYTRCGGWLVTRRGSYINVYKLVEGYEVDD